MDKNAIAVHSEQSSGSALNTNRSFLTTITELLGFEDRVTTAIWFIISLSTTGFVLIYLSLLTDNGLKSMLPPGEFFVFMTRKAPIRAHVIVICPWAIIGSLQFVPAIRANNIDYHKVFGRIYLLFCLAISITGIIMTPYSLGGDLGGQLATFTLFMAFVVTFTMGFISIKRKQIQSHREWMMRSYSVGVSVIVIRIFMPLFLIIMPKVGKFFNVIQCDQIIYELGGNKTAALEAFPSCKDSDRSVVAHNFDSFVGVVAGIRLAYAPATFISLMICGTVVETWIYFKYHREAKIALEAEKEKERNYKVVPSYAPDL